ncbi:hypothetical protein EBU58_11600 [bacterium]|nr:hypothetical protein [bacterium]
MDGERHSTATQQSTVPIDRASLSVARDHTPQNGSAFRPSPFSLRTIVPLVLASRPNLLEIWGDSDSPSG